MIKPRPTVSIVIPIFNEEANVGPLYARLQRVRAELNDSTEIIFVDDGSTDGTSPSVERLCDLDLSVRLIQLSRNFGKEVAMTAGIDSARGEAVIIMDADLQDPPELIPTLIEKWKQGFDNVYAVRASREGESWLKRSTAYAFYRLIGMLSKTPIPADTGDFRLLSRPAIEALKQLRERNRFMKGLFAWVGFKQIGVTYRRDVRAGGRSTWNYWRLSNFAIEGITSFSYLPLQFATFLGLGCGALALVGAGFFIVKTLVYGDPVRGYPSLMVVVLFLSALQLTTLGIIGEYLARTYYEAKGRPLYFVKRRVGGRIRAARANNRLTDSECAS